MAHHLRMVVKRLHLMPQLRKRLGVLNLSPSQYQNGQWIAWHQVYGSTQSYINATMSEYKLRQINWIFACPFHTMSSIIVHRISFSSNVIHFQTFHPLLSIFIHIVNLYVHHPRHLHHKSHIREALLSKKIVKKGTLSPFGGPPPP